MSNKEPLSCFDIVRYTFSIALSLAMMAVIVIGIGGGHAVMPGHPAILFGILMFCIGDTPISIVFVRSNLLVKRVVPLV